MGWRWHPAHIAIASVLPSPQRTSAPHQPAWLIRRRHEYHAQFEGRQGRVKNSQESGLAGIRAENSQKWDNLLLVKNFFADSCRPSIPAACTAE